mgnify:CR=1 FL=1
MKKFDQGLKKWKRSALILCFFSLTLALFLSGCGGSGGGGNSSDSGGGNTVVASKSVGTEGDIIKVVDPASNLNGASVVIPPGALSTSTNITIASVSNPPAFLGESGNNITVDFGPDGTTFDTPAIITVPYDPTEVTDENDLKVYTYDKAGDYWIAEKTGNIDTTNHLATALVEHFSSKTAQQSTETEFDVNLMKGSDKKLVAKVVVTTPFNKMLLRLLMANCTGKSYMSDLLHTNSGDVTFKYSATLMKYNPWPLPDTEVVTKRITYNQTTTNAVDWNYHVSVRKDGATAAWFWSGSLLTDDLFTWYSGEPALFKFDVEPESGKQYYVAGYLEVIDAVCNKSGIYTFNGSSEKTSAFALVKPWDTDEDGIRNAYDSVTPDVTPPSQITGLQLTPVSSSRIDLAWNKSSDNVGVIGYKVKKTDGTLIKTIYSDTPSFSNTGLQPSTNYCYRVTAFDAAKPANESTYAEGCAATLAAPDTTAPTAPTGLSVTVISKNLIDLSWNKSTDAVGVTGYKIYRDGSLLKSANSTAVSEYGLVPNTNYCYEVSAFDAAKNESLKSSKICKQTFAEPDITPPTTPTGLTATAISTSQINLSWNPSADAVLVSEYRVFRDGKRIETLFDTSTTNAGLSPNTQYCYTVLAVDSSSNKSPKSDQACATTQTPVTYNISGKVTLTGTGLAGVTVTLTGSGSNTATTDANGNYLFTGALNGSYTITPAMAGYTFAPVNIAATVTNADLPGQDFVATAVPPGTYNIAGKVTLNGSGLAGVTVTLTGSGSNTATTDANGNYLFAGAQNGSYTITPSKSGYTFAPVNKAATVNNADMPGQDFVATAVPPGTYNISGKVTLNGTGLAGVTVTLSGSGTNTATTDANGNYLFAGAQNGSYTITPSKSGYTFTPVNKAATVNNADLPGQDFVATAITPPPAGGMVLVPAGCFQMGDTFDRGGDFGVLPVHQVCLSSFSIDRYEVTQAEYQIVMGKNPSYYTLCGGNCPVEEVTWYNATEYCAKVGKRLPTEAEWEYAARSGGQNHLFAGTSSWTDFGLYAWYSENSGRTTHPVGQKLPNGLGIYDMSGNVYEWVADWYDKFYYSVSPINNPTGPATGSSRVLRGGNLFVNPGDCSTFMRVRGMPDGGNGSVGIRCARTN